MGMMLRIVWQRPGVFRVLAICLAAIRNTQSVTRNQSCQVRLASMNCDMGAGNRPDGQHGGSRHRSSFRHVIRAKGVAKNCVANFALDRTTGASGSRQIDAVEIEKALLLPPLNKQDQVMKMAQVARFSCASIARCKDRRTLER
jgi:hypothetical protein